MPIDYPLTALIGADFTRKNEPFPPGTPVRIGYAFPQTRPADWPESGFRSLNETPDYRNLVEQALVAIESACGVDFVATPVAEARVVFGVSPLALDSLAGYAQTFYQSARQTYVSYVVYDDSLAAAANFKLAITHEIGHALGLKHPGAYGSDDVGPYLSSAEDTTSYTVMSYHQTGEDRLALGPYDIAALQYLYGQPIAPGVRVGLLITGQTRSGSLADDLLALDSFDVWLNHNDTVFTAGGDGVYRASSTGLTLDGGAGIDEVYVPLARDAVRLTKLPDDALLLESGWQVNLSDGKVGELTLIDRLANIERLWFVDGRLALDTAVDQPAGQAYALLYAALDAAPPPELLGQWLPRFDAGLSPAAVAEEMIAAYAPDLPAATLVELLYRNLVGTAPSAETLAAYAGLIEGGNYSRGGFWAAAAALDLNRVQFVGLIEGGIIYT